MLFLFLTAIIASPIMEQYLFLKEVTMRKKIEDWSGIVALLVLYYAFYGVSWVAGFISGLFKSLKGDT